MSGGILNRIKGFFQDRLWLWVFYPAQKRYLIRTSKFFPREWAFYALSEWEKQKKEIEKELSGIKKRKFLTNIKIEVSGQRFRVKYYSYRHRFFHLLENLAYQSEAMRNFNTLLYLAEKGIGVPRPLVLAEECRGKIALESVLIMEDLEPALSYRQMLERLKDDPKELENFLTQLVQSLAQLHLARVYNRDTDKNVLVKIKNGNYRFFYFDFDNVFFWRKITKNRVAGTLRHFFNTRPLKLSPAQKEKFINIYLQHKKNPSWRKYLIKNT